jgi:hypothetical protein
MDYIVKGEMLTNRDVNKFLHKMREISVLCVWNSTLHVAFIFLFSVHFEIALFYSNSQKVKTNKKCICRGNKDRENKPCSSQLPVSLKVDYVVATDKEHMAELFKITTSLGQDSY